MQKKLEELEIRMIEIWKNKSFTKDGLYNEIMKNAKDMGLNTEHLCVDIQINLHIEEE